MKKVLLNFIAFLFFSGITFSQQIPFLSYPNFRTLNYECGGFVTAVFPAYNSGNLSDQFLYAKTDIGGIYKSTNNGESWILISNYKENEGSIAFSEYINAGIAIHPTDKNQLIVAWGSWLSSDASTIGYQTLWRTTNGGEGENSWSKCEIPSPYLLLDGDYLPTKVGGECLIYDPRPGNYNRVFVGGIDPNGYGPTLFMSLNSGNNFVALENTIFNADPQDTIICIAMHKNRNEIYVGTAKGIYRSPGFQSNGKPQQFEKLSVPSNIGGKNIRRMLIRADGRVYIAYGIKDWNYYIAGGGICWYDHDTPYQDSVWFHLTENFEYNYPGINTIEDNYFSLLAWGKADESVLIAGRVNQPTKKTTNGGVTWSGELDAWQTSPNLIHLIYNHSSGTFPNHQFSQYNYDEKNTFMYGGLNYLIRNPNTNCNDCGNTWYASGGAGLRISDNIAPETDNIFKGKQWNYSTFKQNMPLIYDIDFEAFPSTMVYMPMADWTMAYTDDPQPCMSPGYCYLPLSYDNQNTRHYNSGQNAYENTWSSNVSRTLISNHSNSGEHTTYNIGADTYYGKLAVIYKRIRYDNSGTIYIDRRNQTNVLNVSDRAIVDGIIYDYGSNNDMMLFYIGTQKNHNEHLTDSVGIYFTTTEGQTLGKANFTSTSNDLRFNTQSQYDNSLTPSLRRDLNNGVLYSSQFNLVAIPSSVNNQPFIYLYLQGIQGSGGGMFISSDGGMNWATALNPNCSFNAGCLKSTGNNELVLAIDGVGLLKGSVNSNNGSITSWTSPTYYGFSDAQLVEAKGNNWAVFGKRNGDLFPILYKTSEPDPDHWKLITDRIRGVRSLRIHPYTNDLWIATTGLGVIVYNGLFENQPFVINKSITLNSNTYFEKDIEIDSAGYLTLQGNINFKMAPGKKIYVKEGGKFNTTNVTFNCTDSTQKWEGIYFENSDDSCVIQNCTFNNTTLPIKIVNDESYTFNEKIIKDNIFNCFSSQDYVIYAENVFNMLVQGNQFNMVTGSTSTVGLEVKNSYNNNTDGMTTIIDIIGNTFSNGCASMVLNSYASELTPFYIYGNTFNGSSTHYNIIGRMIAGSIKNNNFAGTSTENPIYFQQCNPDLFGNIINGSGTTMILNGHSYPYLSPYRTSNTFYWHSGQNKLYSTNAGNINIIDAGIPYVNCGYNQFSKNSDQSYFHITGKLDSTVGTFNATRNAWCTSNTNPVNYLYTTGNPSVLTDFNQYYSCNGLPAIQYSSSQITNKGFGINDTLLISTDNTNYSIAPDELLNSQASIYFSSEQYLDAINCHKNLINNYLESQYLNSSLYELFDCYQGLDTSSNTTYRDNLYSDLKTFLNDKIQGGKYSEEFTDIAYYFINMCEVNMDNYNSALTGFEFIAMFHPDATIRLLASWDYAEVQDLMGQSGSEKEENSEQFREKILTKLENVIKKDSTMGIVNRIYKKQNDEIGNSYLSKKENNTTQKGKNSTTRNESISKQDDSKSVKYSLPKEKRDNIIKRAENNLRVLKNMDKERKIKKHKEDILLIADLSSSNSKSNGNENIALTYSLSQNYPNPFNPVTKINYELPKDGKVKIVIYDILGREIKSLVNNEFKTAGRYTVEFNGTQYASGVYFYRIQVEGGKGFTAVKKMVLVK